MNKIILLFSLALLLSGCNRARQEQGREDVYKRQALEDAAIHEHPIENTDFEDVSDDVESNENADDTEGTTEE